jgi:GNAT superfamily N-acetyltransferase
VAALSDFFAGLSPQSRYMRFFVPVTPNPDLLRMLGGGPANVDALVATQGGVIIGHAMTVDRIGHRGVLVADVGVVVADAWQGRGVGSALVRALITRAHARGVTLLEMDVMHANQRVLAMIEHYWPAASTDDGADYLSIRVPLSEHGEQPRAA